ncbi:hypothetical protein PUN28_013702 [Cardiocondyla obscurior]|uniref:Uncharacterized protein n=1 Tax=Cardiocondyla obscurior TaxID=286306 RepID=A0AAW2F553_9HYME
MSILTLRREKAPALGITIRELTASRANDTRCKLDEPVYGDFLNGEPGCCERHTFEYQLTRYPMESYAEWPDGAGSASLENEDKKEKKINKKKREKEKKKKERRAKVVGERKRETEI